MQQLIMKTSFLLVLPLLATISMAPPPTHGVDSLLGDKAALLAFKSSITSDPKRELANWLDSAAVCNFTGVTCTGNRVAKLQLAGVGIHGSLHPALGNLTRLHILDLAENGLSGAIPVELGQLGRLSVLAIDGAGLHGPIPSSFGLLVNLVYLDLRDNFLSGQIPVSFYNCSALGYVDLSGNAISGEIPPLIGHYLANLTHLNLYSNKFIGEIPASVGNLSRLRILDLENNSLVGELPAGIVGKLQRLERLHLSGNHFVSSNLKPLFEALANCSRLKGVELEGIGVGGELPSFAPLAETNISALNLDNNLIYGHIPPDIGLLANLTLLNLSSNFLSGAIPEEITLLQRLEQLILSSNLLSGSIPSTMGGMTSLGLLDISRNNISGHLPDSFGNLSRLEFLYLQENNLSGSIPAAIGSCKSLKSLVLSYNRLSGIVPAQISGISGMGYLNFSNNLLQGSVPLELSKLELLQEVDLSCNKFSGHFISQLESCPSLRVVNFSHNILQGKLSNSIGRLRSLELLDVSYNSLTGLIPPSLNDCTSLAQLNLSYNDFTGSIPTILITSLHLTNLSFLGNCHLSGSLPGTRHCNNSRTKIWAIVVSSIAAFSVLVLLLGCIIRRKMIFFKQSDMSIRTAFDLKLNFPRITYRELEECTGGFHEGRLIGSGGYGRVYKGTLRDGTLVAVKVLRLQTGNSTKSFNKECQVLKRIRHRNLIRIITACSRPDFKAVVLPFMANGSLESHLHPNDQDSELHELSLLQRVNICSDVAEGMAYLHHHSPVRVIHCDLKPSNVLLNDDMTALVSDFGNARLLMNGVVAGNGDSAGTSTANMLCGSIGYMAPGTRSS